MSRSHQSPDSAADEQASLWAAKIEGSSLNAAERPALDAWLNENPAHRALLSKYCQFSVDLKEQLPELAAAGVLELPEEIIFAQSGWRPKRLAAVGLAAAAVAVFALWLALPGRRGETIATVAAQRRSFVLADGSRVELNARTSLFVESGPGERRVRLDGGEVFFVVSKDKGRPFIVTTPAGSVRVTGTQFDVRSETASDLVVTVLEGSVQVRPGETGGVLPPAASLVANDQLSAGAEGVGVRTLSRDAVEDALAWRQGLVVFDHTPLRDALACFARYHGRTISATAGAANRPITGRYSLDDLDAFFADLDALHAPDAPSELRVERLPNGAVRVSLCDKNP